MNELRSELPSLNAWNYLNYGASGSSLLLGAAKKMSQLIKQHEEPLVFHSKEWKEIVEHSRKIVADLISATPLEIAFTTGTSHALSIVANAIKWKKDEVVVYPADEFPSSRFVWENLKEKNVQAYPIPFSKEIPFEKQLEELSIENVRLVSCSAISYRDGRRPNIEAISKVCKKRGWLLAIDAIQAVGAILVNVQRFNCDFLACGGQKWIFGPIGTGFLYIKKEILDDLYVPQVGWNSFQFPINYHKPMPAFEKGAKRFEPGYLFVPAIAALGESIEIMNKIGFTKIFNRIDELTQRAIDEIGPSVLTPNQRGGIVTFESENAKEIGKKLQDENIIVTQRDHTVRISLHASVYDHELEAFFKVYSSFK